MKTLTATTIVSLLFVCIRCEDAETAKLNYYKALFTENIAKTQSPTITITKDPPLDYGQFDFIVVGAGSTGNVIATRLSEISNWTILLLEAGGEEDDFTDIPYLSGFARNGVRDWSFKTTPQENVCGKFKNNICTMPRGRVIGGSSTVNGMHYVRGNAKDYDKWGDGWEYEKVLKYFKKSQNSQINSDPNYHGVGGYLNVQHTKPVLETYNILIEANRELNYQEIDYNGEDQIGVAKTQVTIKSGKRQSTGRAFLENARFRNNLNVTINAFVTKIIIDQETKKASGVYFIKDNDTKYKAIARKEVILSAGAFNTPQLLMLSGIGPKTHLNELAIDIVEDLPVGRNLIEHPNLTLMFKTNLTIAPKPEEDNLKEFFKGYGAYTRPGSIGAIGFLNLNNTEIEPSVPMIEYLYGFYKDTIEFLVLLQHPKSRGSVQLKSKNPTDQPLIDLNTFADPSDARNLIRGVKFILEKMVKTKAFRAINASHISDRVCREFEFDSDEFWRCFLKMEVDWFCHSFGSTRMGDNGSYSVVDYRLKVHGVEGLRVADAGVIPTSMSGHLYAVVVMIGEKAADMIKEDYGVNSGTFKQATGVVIAVTLALAKLI